MRATLALNGLNEFERIYQILFQLGYIHVMS